MECSHRILTVDRALKEFTHSVFDAIDEASKGKRRRPSSGVEEGEELERRRRNDRQRKLEFYVHLFSLLVLLQPQEERPPK